MRATIVTQLYSKQCTSLNHRMVWIGKARQRSSSSNVPAVGRHIFYQTSFLRTPSNLALNTSRNVVSTKSMASLFHCLTNVKKYFFIYNNLKLLSMWKNSPFSCYNMLLPHLSCKFPSSTRRPQLGNCDKDLSCPC